MLQDETISASKCQDEISEASGHAAARGDHRHRRGFTLAERNKLFDAAEIGSCEDHRTFPFRLLAPIRVRASL